MQASRSSKLRTRRNCCLAKGDQCTNCSVRQPKRTYPRCAVPCRALTPRLSLSALDPINLSCSLWLLVFCAAFLFLFSGKRRFKFGRRGSPCVALRPALELDIWGENLNGAVLPPNDQTCDPHILALYRAFFFLSRQITSGLCQPQKHKELLTRYPGIWLRLQATQVLRRYLVIDDRYGSHSLINLPFSGIGPK